MARLLLSKRRVIAQVDAAAEVIEALTGRIVASFKPKEIVVKPCGGS